MRAVQVLTPTPGDVVVREVDEPVPGEHDVLIEVHAFGVSFPDLLLSKGQYRFGPSRRSPSGWTSPGPWSADRASSRGSASRAGAVRGRGRTRGRPGGVDVPDPRLVSFHNAAALPMNYLTAHFALVERGGLRAGETVLVTVRPGASVRRRSRSPRGSVPR